MTKHKSTKLVLFAAVLCLAGGASFLAIPRGGSQQSQEPAQQKPSNDEALALRKAFKRGGLREVAKLKGIWVAEIDPHWDGGKFDVESLTKISAAVIVGRFTKKLDARVLDNRTIFTDYEVAVDELVKGDLKQSQKIVVSLPGGRIFFEDGTSAEHTTPSFEHPPIGRAYTLFLMREDAVPSVFFLSGGPQGMFDIEDSAGVKSRGRPDDAGAVETKGKNRDSFMGNVKDKARKWPNPGKCCG